MAMTKSFEKSCGAVVFRRTESGIRYVLVSPARRRWGFPKGHVEAREREEETALREIREETGLSVTLLRGFRETDRYTLTHEGKPNTTKTVVYFLAQYQNQTPHPVDKEIAENIEADFDRAYQMLYSKRLKEILKKANDFLQREELIPLQAETN